MEVSKKVVTIIVPIYNARKYIANTIESIRRQSYKDLEIILVNDGSTDDSRLICEYYGRIDKRVKIFNKMNGGVSSARNFGLRYATGEYISFVDSDDFLTKDMIETLVDDIQKSNADVAICGYWHVTENEYLYINNRYKVSDIGSELEVLTNPIKYFYSKELMPFMWNKIFRKELIEHINFDESIHYGEDYLFCAMAFMKANKASYRIDKKYFYIKREDGLSMSDGSIEFWSGYARSKKILYDKFVEIDAGKELLQGIWKEYCIAIIAIYRYIVHKRLKNEYYRITKQYKKIMLNFIKESDLKFSKKLEYLSFVLSYKIAILCHKKK